MMRQWVRPGLALVAAGLTALVAPEVAQACTVCPLGSGQTGKTYLITGLLISVTQMASLGTLVWWWRRRLRKEEADDLKSRS